MHLPRIALLALTALPFLSACSQEAMLEKFASAEDRKVATQCIDNLLQGNFEEINAHLDPTLRTGDTQAAFDHMLAMLPKEKPSAVKLVGAQLNVSTEGRESNLTYQYSYGERHFLINCATRTRDSERIIFGLNVNTLESSLEERQRFDLAGKTPLHYAMLLGVIAALVLTLVALIRCVMEKDLRRKWVWVLCIIFGIGHLELNWVDGTWSFSPVYFQLFSAGALSTGYGGWVVSLSLPLGAILYLVRRYRNHRALARSNEA
jgi:hypothetical protein